MSTESKILLTVPIHLIRLLRPLRDPFDNYRKDFYRDLLMYYALTERAVLFSICAINPSGYLAKDVRVEIAIPKSDSYFLMKQSKLPKYPKKKDNSIMDHLIYKDQIQSINLRNEPSIELHEEDEEWIIEAMFEKIQPQNKSYLKKNCALLFKEDIDIELTAKIYADNLSQPIQQSLFISAKVKQNFLSLEDALEKDKVR